MKLTQRTCATCAAFNQAPEGDEPTCGNLVSFTEQHGTPQALSREPALGDYCPDHLTQAEDAAETDRLRAGRQVAESTPEFLEAMHACLILKDELGLEHPETSRALMVAMALAPDSLKDFMAEQAKELGLMPEPDGYTEDGEPVFTLESIAAKMGMSMEEAQAAAEIMLADCGELGLPTVLVDPEAVHRVQ